MNKGLSRRCLARIAVASGVAAVACLMTTPGIAQNGTENAQRAKTLQERVNELEAEQRILKNRIRAMQARKSSSGAGPGYVRNAQKKVSVTIDGQVNRAVLFNLTRGNTEIHHVDNDNSSTRIRIKAKANGPAGWKIEGRIEFELENNASDAVDDTDVGGVLDDLNFRKIWIAFKHKTWGRIALGREDTATNGITEIDLSSTTVILKSEVETVGGDLRHLSGKSAGPGASARSFNVDVVHDNFDGLSRRDLIRYDTPKFYGFWIAVSHANGDALSVALRYVGNPFGVKAFTVAFGLGYDYGPSVQATAPGNAPPASNRSQYGGSVSVLHNPSGISITFAAATQIGHGDDGGAAGTNVNPYSLYLKLGWKTKSLISWGRTAFAVDMFYAKDLAYATGAGGSEATGIGFGIVQQLKDSSTELYLGYRAYFLEFGNDGFATLHVIMTGARIKF